MYYHTIKMRRIDPPTAVQARIHYHQWKKHYDIPVLVGFFDKNAKDFHVYCPYCRNMHTHGATDYADLGHRVAHCAPHIRSPLSMTGYFLTTYELLPELVKSRKHWAWWAPGYEKGELP